MRKSAHIALLLPLILTACSGLPPITGDGLLRIGAAAMPIGPETEREIGFGIAATVAGRYQLVDDVDLNRYVNLVGQAVAQQSIRRGEVDFRFGVLDTDDVNAFAAPGGFIFITRGALALMDSESDLAGVLAHEIAHVDQRHVLDEIRRSSVVQTASDEAELSGPLLDRVAELGSSLLFMGLSREDEMESDSLGVLYATATGYQAAGLVRFLERLVDAEETAGQANPAMREWLATHPSTAERLAVLRGHLERHGIDPAAGQEVRERFRAHVPRAGR
jgi:beta-barrel assembly-enhancing protease